MKELIQYLLQNLYLDFQGDVSMDTVRDFLREDDSKEARALLKKLIEEKGVEDMLISLADVLKENLASGIDEDVIHDQLNTYADSLRRRVGRSRPQLKQDETCRTGVASGPRALPPRRSSWSLHVGCLRCSPSPPRSPSRRRPLATEAIRHPPPSTLPRS